MPQSRPSPPQGTIPDFPGCKENTPFQRRVRPLAQGDAREAKQYRRDEQTLCRNVENHFACPIFVPKVLRDRSLTLRRALREGYLRLCAFR